MKELDLHLKLEKCQFTSSEVEYLGMIVKPGHLIMDPVKLDGITSWPTPTKVKEVWSFLGFTNFYHHFIPDYSTMACPLLNLTKKNHHWDWTAKTQASFNNLKWLFLSKPVLQLPNLLNYSLLPLMPWNMPWGLSSSKPTPIANGTPTPTSPNDSSQQNKTMTFMIRNS